MTELKLIEKALSLRSLYHRLISGNIANANTPGYRAKTIDFQSEMKRNVKRLEDVRILEAEGAGGLSQPDGNTVEMEREVANLLENSLMYNAIVQILVKKFSLMKYIINEGRR